MTATILLLPVMAMGMLLHHSNTYVAKVAVAGIRPASVRVACLAISRCRSLIMCCSHSASMVLHHTSVTTLTAQQGSYQLIPPCRCIPIPWYTTCAVATTHCNVQAGAHPTKPARGIEATAESDTCASCGPTGVHSPCCQCSRSQTCMLSSLQACAAVQRQVHAFSMHKTWCRLFVHVLIVQVFTTPQQLLHTCSHTGQQ